MKKWKNGKWKNNIGVFCWAKISLAHNTGIRCTSMYMTGWYELYKQQAAQGIYLRKVPSVGLTSTLQGALMLETNGLGRRKGGMRREQLLKDNSQIGQNSGKLVKKMLNWFVQCCIQSTGLYSVLFMQGVHWKNWRIQWNATATTPPTAAMFVSNEKLLAVKFAVSE